MTDSELRIRTGLLFRRTAHIRLERIQAIDVTQPLLARVAGVAKLKLDVMGADKKDELAFLGAEEARTLRAELLARAAGFAPETAHEVGEAPSQQLLRVPPGVLATSLVLTGATWATLAAALVVPTVLWLVTESAWTVLATAIPLVGAAGASSVGRFVTEYDWTVGESQDGLRIDHGLLDRAHETVPPGAGASWRSRPRPVPPAPSRVVATAAARRSVLSAHGPAAPSRGRGRGGRGRCADRPATRPPSSRTR